MKNRGEKEKIALLSQELHHVQQDLVKQFYTDPLTRLPNLYKLRHDLEALSEFTLIMGNIDNFKLINDFYGFVIGDFILESFAKTLLLQNESSEVYRIAGDEFAILIREKMSFYQLKNYLSHLTKMLLHLKYAYSETEIFIDCTFSSSASHSYEDVFSKVSMAMKYAKKKQLKFWIYEDTMHLAQEYEKNLSYATKIRKAIVDFSSIVPYFQPIIDNKTNQIVKYEALSRLIDEEGIVHSPYNFIPIAKMIKVYDKITMIIIEKCFEVFRENEYAFSINLSFEDIMNQEICDFILVKLKESKLGDRVTFELLESERVNDFNKVIYFFNEIKRYGAKVAIDDFGSGFSNFSYIIKLNPDYIKIDGSLIKEIDTDKNAQIVVETIVDFSKKLGIKTIAEFVHSSTVLSAVKKLGIDYSQGYFIDIPSPKIIL